MSFVRESISIGGKTITLETGRLAKQAHGAILISLGETVVLVTAVSTEERPGLDFFPLTCEYVEKGYAAGKIPGGFFKREGKQRDDEILSSRIMDRPLRPLFPDGFKKDTQVIATVMSFDKENPSDVLALTGASAALHISDIPWNGPIVGTRVCRVRGELILYPTFQEQQDADIDLVVAVTKDALVMVEGGAAEATEAEVIDALMYAHREVQPLLQLIERLRAEVGKPKRTFSVTGLPEEIKARVSQIADRDVAKASRTVNKQERYEAYAVAKKKLAEVLQVELGDKWPALEKLVKNEFEERKAYIVREYVLSEGRRIDGRDTRTVRPIRCEVGLLPRPHGSALFQRGETQAIVTTTLGTSADEQKIDSLAGERWKRFLLHYNFPPFSTGETKPMRGPGRREVGHGALAERALMRMVPTTEQFPYTVRLVSEILESNGSSSMASVCGGTLAMMDAGVPIKAPVAGIAMGLITDGGRYAILSDILGDEDHLGDMDFKVCGTVKGITAIQMDIKIEGLSREILAGALDQAREGRLHILGKMLEALPQPRKELSIHAPRIVSVRVKPEQVRVVIGTGGKNIKGIIDQTGVSIEVKDDGTIHLASSDADAVRRAIEIIKGLTTEPEVGIIYKGVVKRVLDFGAFVEILPGIDGLVHISELAHGRVDRVEDVLKEGDPVEVKVLSIDRDGKIRLSRREALPPPVVPAPSAVAVQASAPVAPLPAPIAPVQEQSFAFTPPLPPVAPQPTPAVVDPASPAPYAGRMSPLHSNQGVPPVPGAGPSRGALPVPGAGPSRGAPPIPGAGPSRGAPPVPGAGLGRGAPPVPGAGPSRGAPPVPGAGPSRGAPPVPGMPRYTVEDNNEDGKDWNPRGGRRLFLHEKSTFVKVRLVRPVPIV